MASVPLGIRLVQKCGNARTHRNVAYRYFILVFTFLAYTSYHLSRKPISVVKAVLHQNCSIHLPDNRTIYTTNASCSWAPFDGDNADELLGSLDYSYLFAYAVGMFVSGHFAERMNLRYFLTMGMLMSGALTAAFGFGRFFGIHSIVYYILVQIVCGFFQSTGWPSVVTCVANWFGKGKRGFIMGIWNSHTSVGNILGSVIPAFFVSYNWGWSFVVPGIIISAMGVLVFLFLIPRPEDVGCELPDHHGTRGHTHPYAKQQYRHTHTVQGSIQDQNGLPPEAEPLVVNSADPEDPKKEEKAISLLGALRIPGVIEFALCLFFAKLVSYTFLFWLPKYISNSADYNPTQAADLSTLFDVGGIIGGIAAGAVSDYTGGRATTCVFMLGGAAPMLFVYQKFGATSLAVNIVLLLICGSLVNGPYALITTAVSADLGTHQSLKGNSRALATVTAIIDGTGSMGAALGPLLTGLITRTGWQNVFYMLIAADVCAMILLSRLVAREVQVWLRYRRAL